MTQLVEASEQDSKINPFLTVSENDLTENLKKATEVKDVNEIGDSCSLLFNENRHAILQGAVMLNLKSPKFVEVRKAFGSSFSFMYNLTTNILIVGKVKKKEKFFFKTRLAD